MNPKPKVEYRPYPRDPGYLAGSDGSIIGPSGRVLKPFPNKWRGGYLAVKIRSGGPTTSVHLVVAEAWHGPCPEGMECAHENGNHLDNRPQNLRWKWHFQNMADKILHGTHRQGEQLPQAKLTTDDVRAIREAYSTGRVRKATLGRQYGVTGDAIGFIVSRKTWKHVT